MSQTHVNHAIRLLEELGPHPAMEKRPRCYFELSQLTRITSAEFRAIASAIEDSILQVNGESVALTETNAVKITEAID
jgi:hypothetical protein